MCRFHLKDKYKPWPLLKLLESSLLSAGIPIILAIIQKQHSIENVEKLLWLYTAILLVIFIAFFSRDRWCCSKKDDQIDLLEIDATKYQQLRDTEIQKLHDQSVTAQANHGYSGKHGMQQLNDKIN